MAAAGGPGCTHFSSYCAKIANIPPVEFLIRCRLESAGQLLAENAATSVTEIVFRCGFQSSQYFARVFRARFGRSPSE